jgi:hypothetical protein
MGASRKIFQEECLAPCVIPRGAIKVLVTRVWDSS